MPIRGPVDAEGRVGGRVGGDEVPEDAPESTEHASWPQQVKGHEQKSRPVKESVYLRQDPQQGVYHVGTKA